LPETKQIPANGNTDKPLSQLKAISPTGDGSTGVTDCFIAAGSSVMQTYPASLAMYNQSTIAK
jgi:hypothetical protein